MTKILLKLESEGGRPARLPASYLRLQLTAILGRSSVKWVFLGSLPCICRVYMTPQKV